MLTKRQEAILRYIVEGYIATANPVASESIARRYPLGISPATVRLEMAELEEEGFILRLHHSAGGVPSDKGYRYYVEYLDKPRELSAEEQVRIEHLFQQVAREVEEWLRLAAMLLSHLTGNAALFTWPRTPRCRLQHLELVALHHFRALLILALWQAQLRQRFLTFDHPVSQEELNGVAQRLNQAYSGLDYYQIQQQNLELSPLEDGISQAILKVIETEELALERPYIYGLPQVFRQPEFSQAKIVQLMEVAEDKEWLRPVLPRREGVRVVIGREHEEEAMRSCSLVIGRYGLPEGVGGALGVLGPTRMPYGQAISAVDYLCRQLSEMLSQAYG